jgi:hypothetical protein
MIVWCACPALYIFCTCIEPLPQVCGIRPKHPGYPTCGMTCAGKLKASGGSSPQATSTRGPSNPGPSYPSSPAGSSSPMCVVSASSLCYRFRFLILLSGKVCGIRPSFNKGGKKYPTCGLTCKAKYEAGGYSSPGGQNPGGLSSAFQNLNLGRGSGSTGGPTSAPSKPGMCVVSYTRLRYATACFLFHFSHFSRFVVLSHPIPREERVTPRVVLAVRRL